MQKKMTRQRNTKNVPTVQTNQKMNEPILGIIGNTLWILENQDSAENEKTLSVDEFDKPLSIEWTENRDAFFSEILMGHNLLENGDFEYEGKKSLVGWKIDSEEATLAGLDLADEWRLEGGHSAYLLAAEDAPRPSFNLIQKIPIIANIEYQFTGYFATQRSDGFITVYSYDENHQILSEEQIHIVNSPKYSGGKSLDKYQLVENLFTPVKGSKYLSLKIALGEQIDLSLPNSYLFFTKLHLGLNDKFEKNIEKHYAEDACRLSQSLFNCTNGLFGKVRLQNNKFENNIIVCYRKNFYELNINLNYFLDKCFCELSSDEHVSFELASSLGLFDAEWYQLSNKDLKFNSTNHPWLHYTQFGWSENRNPSPVFNEQKYSSTYRSRESIVGSALMHFIEKGRKIGLQYWPTENFVDKLDRNRCDGVFFIKSPHDPFTMIYRVDAIMKEMIDTGSKNITYMYSNNIDKSVLVHSLRAIVISRAHLTPDVRSILNRARNFNVPILFDIDDFVWDSSSKSQLRSLLYKDKTAANNLNKSMENWRNVMLEVDAIIVSTWPLRKLTIGFGKPVTLIPNSVPKKYQVYNRSFEKFCRVSSTAINIIEIGYFSGTNTHQYDVDECANALARIMNVRNNINLKLVGHADYLVSRLSQYRDRIIEIPLLNYTEMLSEISKCDIVIAPLETRNVFCDCKSELKLFEAAMFSVPVVCSPTATYTSTIVDGMNGYLAGNENEWFDKLLLLIDNSDLRTKLGEQAKLSILPRFETENIVKLFKHFINNLKENLSLYKDQTKLLAPSPAKKKNLPLLSLVTILHNKSKELPDFFRGIQSQLFDGAVEIILVDDLSTDDSVRITENWIEYIQYSQFNDWITPIVLCNENNIGNCLSRNKGIDAASADIVIIVDADCVLSSNFFSTHLNAHLTGAGGVVIGYRGIETNETPPSLMSTRMELVPREISRQARNQDSFLLSDFVNCVTRNISFNKKLFPLRFDELFSYTRSPKSGFGWEDVEFGYRLFKAGAQAVFIENCFTLHVSHPYEGDDGEKAKKSAQNFRRLLDKHPDICLLNPGWVKTTGDAIQKWLERSNYDLTKIEDSKVISKHIASLEKSNILIKTKDKKLRILSHKWHSPHQYELCKSQHELTYLVSDNFDSDFYSFESKNWDYSFRPRPANIKFVRLSEVDFRNYDLMIGHFDENVLHPEYCNGVLKSSWGENFKFLLELRKYLPMICVCHGTPQFNGQYNIFYDKDNLGQVIEQSRVEMVTLLGETLVVLNSHQAQEEWQFKNSKVIWHGFQPSEFFPCFKDRSWVAMSTEKTVQRPVYNGYYLFKNCIEKFGAYLPIEELKVNDSDLRIARTADHEMWARAKFAKYRQELGRTWFYLNFTQRSPMPRIRGESMMSGVIPVTTSNHDAKMFVNHGNNGFLFDTPDEFCETVRYIESHTELWEKWSNNARLTAIKEFHIDRYLAEWQKIIVEKIS